MDESAAEMEEYAEWARRHPEAAAAVAAEEPRRPFQDMIEAMDAAEEDEPVEKIREAFERGEKGVTAPYCDHFDCACPPFVTDGRVSYADWDLYVHAMAITPEEQARAKWRIVTAPDETTRRLLAMEAEHAELHRDDDIEYQRARPVHNPWDATCVKHIVGERSRKTAICRACHPL